MGIEEILSKLRAIDGITPELVSQIETSFSSVNGEAAGWRKKLREAESRITRLNELIGEGDKDAETTLKGFKDQIETLTKDKEKLEGELKTANEEKEKAITAKTEQEKVTHFAKAATKAGADVDALTKLLPDLTVEMVVIEEEGVFVTGEGGKKTALNDYAKEKGGWVVRAIFPSGDTGDNEDNENTGALPRVPTAPAKSPPKPEQDSANNHLKRNFPLTRLRKKTG